jgi:hypothetical protein
MRISGTKMRTTDPNIVKDFAAAQANLDRQADIRAQNAITAARAAAGAPVPRPDTAGAAPASGIVWADPDVQPYEVDLDKTNAENQVLNLAAAVKDRRFYNQVTDTFTPKGMAHLAKDIPLGGIGKFTPGAMIAAQGASAPEVTHVMQKSERTGGYEIFNPRGRVSVPPGYSLGPVGPALITLGSLVAGGPAGAAITGMQLAARAPGIGRWIGDKWIEQELPGSGLIEWKRDLQEKLGLGGVGRILAPVQKTLGDVVSGVGTAVGNILPEGVERAPQPFQQPSWSPGAAQLASAMPGEPDELLLEEEAAQVAAAEAAAEAEEPFVTDPATLARLAQTAAYGRRRIGLA